MISALRPGFMIAVLLLGAAALAPPAGSATADKDPCTSILPLVRTGRTLHFLGRSRHSTSHANLAPTPQVAFVRSSLQVVEKDAEGWFVLAEENVLYSADGDSMGRLGSPRDRRTRRVRVEPGTGSLAPEAQYTRPPEEDSRQSRPLEITRTDDGFGLNAEARTAVGLSSLILPDYMYSPLAGDEIVVRDFDFWLVREDPREDRRVVPVGENGGRAPAGAEGRVRGTARLRPRGRESFSLNWRHQPGPADHEGAAPQTSPDRRVTVEAMAVSVHVNLVMDWLPDREGSIPPAVRREDRMTWIVLAEPGEPWILEADGSVTMEVGEAPDNTIRKASLYRRLDLVKQGLP
jgi:hypothetical protein